MKKTLSILMASAMLLGLLGGCSTSETETGTETPATGGDSSTATGDTATGGGTPSGNPVSLTVETSYGGTDGNAQNYQAAWKAFEAATGHTVVDTSRTADESWKSDVATYFDIGPEPDVLFYFSGVDANNFIADGKMVSLETIRASYPDYATNMIDDMLPVSPYDGEVYCVPVNGFWEGLFVNKTVLADAGVEIPGADYTWDAFLADCETIKNAGYTPVAVSLQEVPHYWFEFSIMNNGSPADHLALPTSLSEPVGTKWIAAMDDLKELYDLGYLPRNTLTASDEETVQLMAEDEAAFLIDGNWKINYFNAEADPENFAVTYVPSKGDRVATDVVGGMSMGYYITQKAWDDPDTRAAAVAFVQAMTQDSVVNQFATTSISALKNPSVDTATMNGLEKSAVAMAEGATSVTGAVQDNIQPDLRGILFRDIKEVMAGNMTSTELDRKSVV